MSPRQRVQAREGGDDTQDTASIIFDLRAELRRTIEAMSSGRVADRARLCTRARELDQAVRKLTGGAP